MKISFGERVLIWFYKCVNAVVPWHRLPKYIGSFNLLALRIELRAENLHDTYPSWEYQGNAKSDQLLDTKDLSVRNSDGKFNDLERPRMGCAGMRFGRNVPRQHTGAPTHEQLMNPNPRIISERLLARKPGTFKPATIVNLLAAAWIQFQVHDWLQHFNSTEQHEIPLPQGDKWPERPMRIDKTQPDEILGDEDVGYPAYKNQNTHWWDGSQIYGSSEAKTASLRSHCKDGKLKIDLVHGQDFLPRGEDGIPLTGFNTNWWLGLELIHTLFAMEHNSICNHLRSANPDWTSDQLFDTARLINCALMAKIHTVEWTPAILAHPTLQIAMDANWSGIVGEKLGKIFGRISKSESISGIPGSVADHNGAPFSLTEEFTSVYRLHPLIPDDIAFFNVRSGVHKATLPIQDVAFEKAREPFDSGLTFADVFYSFGINYPGAITIQNTPNFLRDLHLPDGHHLDMGTIDILRDRERGVPRYNQFRRLFHMPPVPSFEALTGGNISLATELREIYNSDLEMVDLLVGCLCEPLPKGFGFSDTAFRVFILMASRRLKSDRYIATDWKPEVYTHEGLAWVQDNTMKDVLCRHFPELKAPLRNVQNAFAPWEKVGRSKEYAGKETNA
ncbi:hypothetical protein GJ744_008944 [Endocarpon pusillum]|uniref:Uncharacterized protein n=1 Tax=Endocarpon pusillum TaxID=364733 RepID=A0A8H7AIS6_9EURO|nr:hypothetical protein GJ744_008944 [Endocarpon pusillum]